MTTVSERSSRIAHSLTGRTPPPLLKFGQLKCFAFQSNHPDPDNISDIQQILSTRSGALHTLVINNRWAHHLDSPLSTSNLRNLHLSLTITSVSCLNQLLEGGQKLESLQLEISSKEWVISRAFRLHSGPGSFPFLREFAFVFFSVENDDGHYEGEDPDLFPAVAEIVRGHPMLEALCLSYRAGVPQNDHVDFGYTAAIWGVLPTLVRLRTLSMDVPKDLSSALGGLLVPRTVVALGVQVFECASWEINRAVTVSMSQCCIQNILVDLMLVIS